MTSYKYYELIASYYAVIFDCVKQGTNIDQSNIRSYDDLWLFPESENYLHNLVVYIQFMKVIYALRRAFTHKLIEVYKKQLQLVQENIKVSDWLSEEELEHFNETVDQLNYEIENWERENTIA